jgi:hypothetical protein
VATARKASSSRKNRVLRPALSLLCCSFKQPNSWSRGSKQLTVLHLLRAVLGTPLKLLASAAFTAVSWVLSGRATWETMAASCSRNYEKSNCHNQPLWVTGPAKSSTVKLPFIQVRIHLLACRCKRQHLANSIARPWLARPAAAHFALRPAQIRQHVAVLSLLRRLTCSCHTRSPPPGRRTPGASSATARGWPGILR